MTWLLHDIQLKITTSVHLSPFPVYLPVHIQLVVDNLSDGLSVCCRSWQSTVDFIMKRRQFVHHPIHHWCSGWSKEEDICKERRWVKMFVLCLSLKITGDLLKIIFCTWTAHTVHANTGTNSPCGHSGIRPQHDPSIIFYSDNCCLQTEARINSTYYQLKFRMWPRGLGSH